MDLGVSGANFVLVGGTTGIGFAAAEQLAADGAHVALLARDEDRARARAARLADEHGVRAVGIGVDAAATGDGMARAVEQAAASLGPLRGLAVTAGPMKQQGPFLEHADDSWDWYYQMILMATVRSCRAVIPHLQRNGGGTIVTTAAYSVRAPKVLIPPYNALKAAVLTLSKILAKTHGADGIRVNTVCPGLFDTEVNDFIRAQRAAEYGVPLQDAIYTHLSSNPDWNMRVALGRGGRPTEAGELIAFLLGERAAYLTGAAINIDGGTDF
ncbi:MULTISPECIES: SDR family oxidoreductase [Mycobacterium]|jgi:NAD(P)-dependent dehydrogenase (short-subunit alcohol dehydrogenase family)|uniref:Short-chain dehydrogenase n=1 Tax=Mycobacterium gordonae TaxID=1778 RepID=A0A1A6B672_MYCGO|nr:MULTISPECIES: SDR family oxidoreductase [Mycobacterium]MBI2702034.1 SDR family oxidoreductase [Mycobacterium sp.]MBX9978163.1 SDR family oxidoreductase [Mycobacterium gordonae]MCQ4360547.1 SDR family oxidoreductase [Mycobacterium gordonae]MCV7007375.1 SDR family oxidoreductase [Mycobacterium gordonae]OBR97834.1 short-chain dehydrogenase [Mycobacterium gordonae]